MALDKKLYVKHKLTAEHWRRNRKPRSTVLGICSCGWKNKLFRSSLRTRARKVMCVFGHKWEDPEPIEVGPVYEENGEWVSGIDRGEGYTFHMRQCERCYKVEEVVLKSQTPLGRLKV